jgi:hypothetical protein
MEQIKAFSKYLVEFQWSYIAYAVPVALIILFFYLKNKKAISDGFKGFINWMRPSLETGGFSSPEKLTAFTVLGAVYIPASIIFAIQSKDPAHSLIALIVHATFICVLFKIISPAQLLELKNGIKPSEPNNPDDKLK